jgi:hypothetical protein
MATDTRAVTQIKGACGHDCPDTCGWVVDVVDGEAVKMVGDPDHPFTRGTLCAKVNHYLERVYHPDRVLYPLKRVGAKGEGRFTRVTWDEALADIAARWTRIVDQYGAEALLPYSSAGVQGLIQQNSIDMRLFGAMGCSLLDRNICGAVAATGLAATIGVGSGIDPEDIVACAKPLLTDSTIEMGSLFSCCADQDADNPAVVKVVVDRQGFALYFSRHAIPYARNERVGPLLRHVGLYAYNYGVLQRFKEWRITPLEATESLEQLRFLENGVRIKMSEGSGSGSGVDTPEQAEEVRKILSKEI